MIIAFFGTEEDASYTTNLQELIGPGHAIKCKLYKESDDIFFQAFCAQVTRNNIDTVICTNQQLLPLLLKALPDFKPSYDKRGKEVNYSLNDYHGSFFTISGFRLGREKNLDVLILNPLEHLYTVPEARYIFKRFISKITKPEKWFPQSKFTYEVATPATIEALYEEFKSAILISCDIETDEDSPHRTINCSGYCALWKDGTTHTVVIPTLDMWGVMWMRKFNQLPAPKVFQGGQYDNAYYMRYNSPVFNWLYDTQNLFHSWYSELPKRLDYITAFAIREVRFWKDDGKSGNLEDHYKYNARDCWATLNSWCSLLTEVPDWAIENYLQEFPLNFPALHTELDGLRVNEDRFNKSKLEVEEKLEAEEQKLKKWIHPDYNPGSSQQTIRLLKVLGIRNVVSSNDPALMAAAFTSPFNELICTVIQNIRGYRKLLSTYMKWDLFWSDRLYYRTNPAGTAVARFSSVESSFWCGFQIQNVPRDKTVKCFIQADEGWLLGENDQPQSEARCIGYMAGCENMIDLVEGPHDYHSWNAHRFFGLKYEEIYDEANKKVLRKDIRDLSKRTNHGANYNMTAPTMLETMGPKLVAQARKLLGMKLTTPLIRVCESCLFAYEATYPEIKRDYKEHVKQVVKLTHKLVSPLGWTRYFFGDPSKSKRSLDMVIAHGPANLSVGIINKAYYQIWRESVYGRLRGFVRLKAQIHDSILYCYKGDWVPNVLRDMMIYPVEVKDIKGKVRTMKIVPDVSCGKEFWSELK